MDPPITRFTIITKESKELKDRRTTPWKQCKLIRDMIEDNINLAEEGDTKLVTIKSQRDTNSPIEERKERALRNPIPLPNADEEILLAIDKYVEIVDRGRLDLDAKFYKSWPGRNESDFIKDFVNETPNNLGRLLQLWKVADYLQHDRLVHLIAWEIMRHLIYVPIGKETKEFLHVEDFPLESEQEKELEFIEKNLLPDDNFAQ